MKNIAVKFVNKFEFREFNQYVREKELVMFIDGHKITTSTNYAEYLCSYTGSYEVYVEIDNNGEYTLKTYVVAGKNNFMTARLSFPCISFEEWKLLRTVGVK